MNEATTDVPIQLSTTDEDATPRLITHNDVVGWMAYYATVQHPYGRPEGLFDVTDAIEKASEPWSDGVSSLHMWRVSGWLEIERWLCDVALKDHPVLTAWNTPRSGHTQQIVATSRYWTVAQIDDFIDIDALLRNVALATWRRAND